MGKTVFIQNDLSKAVSKLKEALNLEVTDVVRDSAIQRFEFCVELSWKLMKSWLLESEGIEVASPKEAIRKAYTSQLIVYDIRWLDIIDLRNITSHTYNEELAAEVFSKLNELLPLFEALIEASSQRST